MKESIKIPLKSILADSYKEVALTAKEFLSKKQALRVVSSVQIDTSKGNIRKRVKKNITMCLPKVTLEKETSKV